MPHASPQSASSPHGYTLVAVTGEQTQTLQLPDRGEVTVGSAPECACRIEHPTIAPQHVRLTMGASLEIEDLGSKQGTKVRGKAVKSGGTEKVGLGEPVTLGTVICIIQKRIASTQRRIWTHGYFESRVEEECLRAERSGESFAVLRVNCPSEAGAGPVEEALSDVLRLVDVVGAYSPGEYEAILLDTKPEGVKLVSDRIRESLHAVSPQVAVGYACFPLDGRDADTLMARAGGRARGEEVLPSEPMSGATGMRQIHELVERIAATDINVLILGETGVGKERLAEMIHKMSHRKDKPFVGLNVTALTESLLESELFGHERGAFTGAVAAKSGLLESADGGTVLLDELGDMPMTTQAKLLRVLETRQVLRVGGTKARPIDVRFIAATNRDLEAEIERGGFREDLFYRLNGMSFVLPPLRERTDEIEGIARGFAEDSARRYGRPAPEFSPAAMSLMKRYAWPGNIRELRNVVERAVVVTNGATIGLEHLPVEKMSASFARRKASFGARPPPSDHRSATGPAPAAAAPVPAPAAGPGRASSKFLRDEIRNLEKERITNALNACAGNQTEAAKLLGMSRRTLVSRLGLFGIPRPRKPVRAAR